MVSYLVPSLLCFSQCTRTQLNPFHHPFHPFVTHVRLCAMLSPLFCTARGRKLCRAWSQATLWLELVLVWDGIFKMLFAGKATQTMFEDRNPWTLDDNQPDNVVSVYYQHKTPHKLPTLHLAQTQLTALICPVKEFMSGRLCGVMCHIHPRFADNKQKSCQLQL